MMSASGGILSTIGNGSASVKSLAGEMDFKALAMESESLLSHIARPDGIPRLTKSLAEIERGSQRMGADAIARSRREALSLGVTPEVAEQKQELKGGSMLARNRFDPESLVRAVNAVQLKGDYQPLQPLGETDIEGYLAHHHDMIIATAVDETRRAAEEAAHVRQREYEVDCWRYTKQRLLEEMANDGVMDGGAPSEPLRALPYASHNSHGTAGPGQEQVLALRAAPEFSNGERGSGSPLLPSNGDRGATGGVGRSRLSKVEADHASVFYELCQLSGASRKSFLLATKLAEAAQSAIPAGHRSGPEWAYANACKITCMMLEGDSWEERGKSNSRLRLHGTLRYLEDQLLKLVQDKVAKAKEASLLDNASLKDSATGLPPNIRAYLRLERLVDASTPGEPVCDGLALWPQIYLCMRCGGYRSAAELALTGSRSLANAGCHESERELLAAVGEVLQDRGKFSQHRALMEGAFKSMAESEDMFKRSVLNILSVSSPGKLTRINKGSVEDYMWFKLSFVVGGTTGMENLHSDVLASAQNKVRGTDARRNFDPDGRNPYAYVNVLLYTQQLGEAVAFLHWKGHHFAALHLALAMSHHGAYEAFEVAPSRFAREGEPGPPPPLKELVERYASGIADSDPEVCADYMLLLPEPDLVDSMSTLLARIGSKAALKVLGLRNSDGRRAFAKLDRHLTNELVEEVALEAGRKAVEQGKRVDAMSFYGSAGEWTRMASLLAREMSERLEPESPDRDFWKSSADSTLELLGREDQMGNLTEAARVAQEGIDIIRGLMDFYSHAYRNELPQALQAIQHVGLLPGNYAEAERTARMIRVRSPDDALRIILPEVLELGMQCLRHHFLTVKRDLLHNAPERIDVQQWRASQEQRLNELETRGQLMLGMAGRLHDILPASFLAELSRLNSNNIT